MKIKLKKPILHNGGEVKELDIPIENLTGNDMIEVETQIMRTGYVGQTLDMSRMYQISLAARAAHMPVEALKDTCASDFSKIVNAVRDFFERAGLGRIRNGKISRNPGVAPRNVLRRNAVRLARADTGTSVIEWLSMPITQLHEWVNIINDENEKINREIKNKRKGR